MTDSNDKLREYHATLSELERRRAQNKLAYYAPYPKQRDFHTLGATKRERLLLGANQSGKTWANAMELAAHLTGRYPEWWTGRKFVRPVRAWAVGMTGESTRDTLQRLLLGSLGQQGTGSIPADAILEVNMGRGIADAVDTVLVRHSSGGVSQLSFKSQEKGREKLQGETLDVVAWDEEPDLDVYSESMARVAATGGMVYLTATPLKGMTAVIQRFISEPSPDRAYVQMSLEESGHFTPEERQRISDGYPEHEREARTKGVPMLGSGRVFQISESVIKVDPMEIPSHWARIAGIDLGFDHPSAAAFLAHDRDTDTIYLYDAWKARGIPGASIMVTMASAIRARGETIPVAWPHDAARQDPTSGVSFAKLFKNEGLNMLEEHATFEAGGYSTEAGVQLMANRFHNGTLRVFSHLEPFFEEFRVYHRKDGLIVKENDDLLSALRIGLMMIRHAKTDVGPGGKRKRREPFMAVGIGDSPIYDNPSSTSASFDLPRRFPGNPEAEMRYAQIHGDRPRRVPRIATED
ncbi:MAG: terminase large subunit [Sulfuricaulis sp.]|uniref:terminase large subunit domain-containing protein n=1 Tax=Sulfuricaulis sp. TaxID=2003553 RepID=UPI0025FD5150|nr:terminase family protein [Sulfuricaulis sp.]MCR4346501.1 terminase large subunit [Sulfuricaulis sp.]